MSKKCSEDDSIKIVLDLCEYIISLLGRIVFPKNTLRTLITKNTKHPEKLVRAYNLCNGERTGTEIAKKVGLTSQGMNNAIRKWENMGIVMNLGGSGRGTAKLPLKLYKI